MSASTRGSAFAFPETNLACCGVTVFGKAGALADGEAMPKTPPPTEEQPLISTSSVKEKMRLYAVKKLMSLRTRIEDAVRKYI